MIGSIFHSITFALVSAVEQIQSIFSGCAFEMPYYWRKCAALLCLSAYCTFRLWCAYRLSVNKLLVLDTNSISVSSCLSNPCQCFEVCRTCSNSLYQMPFHSQHLQQTCNTPKMTYLFITLKLVQ